MGQEFNKYMDQTFEYLDQVLANSIKVNETFNSKLFRQEMHMAFKAGRDPIDFVEDFLRDQRSWGMEEASGDDISADFYRDRDRDDRLTGHAGPPGGGAIRDRSCPNCHGVGFAIGGPEGQYDECPNCTDPATGATLPPEKWKSAAPKKGGLTHGYDSIASVFGKKSEAIGDPGDQSARGKRGPVEWDFDIASDGFDEEYLRYLADQYGIEITEINPEGPGGGNPQVFAKARDIDTARRFMKGIYGEPEGYTDGDYGLPEAAGGELNWDDFETFFQNAINHADDIGIKQRVWNSPGFEQAAKKAFDAGERDPFMWAQEYYRESRPGFFRKDEAHGQNAAKRDKPFSRTLQNRAARKEPAPDFGGEPGEDMFFGDKQADDFLPHGTMLDPSTPSDEFKGQRVHDFDQDDTDDVPDDMLGRDISDDDIDSIWGPEGQQEPPGSDVHFPEYDYDDPDVPREPQTWFDKQYGRPGARKKLEPGKDIRTTPDRKGIGDDDKYTGDRFVNFMDKGWRKAMGYDEAAQPIRRDRDSAADAHHRDMKTKRDDDEGFRTEKGGHFEFDPETGDLKRS